MSAAPTRTGSALTDTTSHVRAAKRRLKEQLAAAKAKREEEQLAADQSEIDAITTTMTPAQRDEVFLQLSRDCAAMQHPGADGRIVLACALRRKARNCVDAAPFTPELGRVPGGKGAVLSSKVTDGLAEAGYKIDATFVSRAEGGSYLAPYVPYWEVSYKDGKARRTTGNKSGATIGTGVDLGAISEQEKPAYLKRLREKGVSEPAIKQLEPLIGKKRSDACGAVRTAQKDGPIVLSQRDVELIDEDAMLTRAKALEATYNAKVKKVKAALNAQHKAAQKAKPVDAAKVAQLAATRDGLRRFRDLSAREQTVLFSTYYHEGNIGKTGNFTSAAMVGDPDAARAALADKAAGKDALTSQRGSRELEYWDTQYDALQAPVLP